MHLVFPTALLPDVQSDAMSLLLGADQVHVVGDEELASAGYRSAPRRYKLGWTEVRGPIITLQLQEREQTQESVSERKLKHFKVEYVFYVSHLLR